jgi:hypothetical protein
MPTEGYLKKKNWFTPGMRMAQARPTTQARRVDNGIEGSSVLETAERTSGYGDSSSSAKAVGSKFGSSWSSIATLSRCVFFPTERVRRFYFTTQGEGKGNK